MRNGNSLSHPEAVSPVLGIFTLVTIIASFATAAYGVSVVHMRMHHAHSLPVFVVLETFQSIFFTGALSVNWYVSPQLRCPFRLFCDGSGFFLHLELQ